MDSNYQKAQQLTQNKKYEAAIPFFQKAEVAMKNSADFWSDFGVTLFHVKKKTEALDAMNRSQQLDAENPYRYSSRAYIHSFLGNTEEAITDYKQCLALDPTDAIALNNLGLVYEKQGHAKKAQEMFREADKAEGIDHITEKYTTPKTNSGSQDKENKTETDSEKPVLSQGRVIREALFTTQGRKDFVRFIRKGFKL